MYYTTKYNLRPGDVVKEAIFLTGLSKHYAIYLGIDNKGNEWVAENHKFDGVRLVPAANFFSSSKKYDVIAFRGTEQQRQVAVRRALEKVNAPYNLITYNCEHYATYVQTGNAVSSQVKNALTIAGISLLAFLFVRSINND